MIFSVSLHHGVVPMAGTRLTSSNADGVVCMKKLIFNY